MPQDHVSCCLDVLFCWRCTSILNWERQSRVYTHPQVAVSDDEVKQERNCGKMRTKVLIPSRISHQVSFSGPRKKCFSIIIGIKELPEAKSPSTLQIPLFSCCKEEVFIFVLFPCFDSPSRRRRRDSIHRTFSLFYFSIGYLWGRIYTIMVRSLVDV